MTRTGPIRAAAQALAISLAASLGACTNVLPSKHDVAIAAFPSFEEARSAYGKVIIDQSTIADLKAIGFDPEKTQNIRQVTYLQILQAFVPRQDVPFSTVPTSVQNCIAAQTRCIGYAIAPKVSHEKRVGSVMLDFFNFRRKTETTGWSAEALFVLLDGVVVYKLWSGDPNLNATSTAVNPLGPLQNLGAILERAIPTPN